MKITLVAKNNEPNLDSTQISFNNNDFENNNYGMGYNS